jgi:hypothetical protein
MREDDDLRRSGGGVGVIEEAALGCGNPQDAKQRGRDAHAAKPVGHTCDADGVHARLERPDRVQHRGVSQTPIRAVGEEVPFDRSVCAAMHLPQTDEPVGTPIRQRLDQHAVHDREDGRHTADAQRHRDQHGCREPAVSYQKTQGVSHVTNDAGHAMSRQMLRACSSAGHVSAAGGPR